MPPKFEESFRVIRNNGGLKLIALLLSIAAWYAIRDTTSNETLVKDVPLTIRLDPGWSVLDRTVNDVDIQFRGSAQDLRFLNRDQIMVDIDVRGKSVAGSMPVTIKPRMVRSPGGARTISIEPSELVLSLDREGDIQVPVKADIVGQLPEGVEVEKVACTPASVVLHGPEQRLRELDVVLTEPIDLEGRIRSFKLRKALVSPGETWTSRMEPEMVDVDVTLIERSSRREIEGVKVNALQPSHEGRTVRIEPSMVKIVFEGRADEVLKIDATSLLAFVDCTRLEPGQSAQLPVRVQLPPGVKLVSAEPAIVMSEVEDKVSEK